MAARNAAAITAVNSELQCLPLNSFISIWNNAKRDFAVA